MLRSHRRQAVKCALLLVVACNSKRSEPQVVPPAPVVRVIADASVVGIDAVAPEPITIAATGDLMLGSTYPDTSGRSLPPDDGAALFADVSPVLTRADLAFGNLEGPLFDGGDRPSCSPGGISERNHGRPGTTCWAFRMPVRLGARLREAGFDVLGIANNHIDDFGAAGRASTIAILDRLGLAYSGPTGTVSRLVVRGRAIHVIAFAPYPGLNDMNDLVAARALVEASHAAGALVVVSFHGGAEGVEARHVTDKRETFWGEDRGMVREFARKMIDAGADLVVGHGPHVLRALEVYRGRLIAYSLGTFASYGGISIDGLRGVTMILEVKLAGDGRLVGGTIHSIIQRAPGGPSLDADRAAVTAVRDLSRADSGAAAPSIADDGTFSMPRP
jgi:poly-gamma-glutamate capsule biosynthesis protein CapA/YwtB (metallophosphatase superfamily)